MNQLVHQAILNVWPIAALEVRELVLGTLLNHALETEEGSRDGELNGNDISGACSYSPSHVVRKKSFRRKFIFQKEWITPLIETWSAELIGEFFIRLETLGGYYAARWESFTHPDYHWSSPALSSRSKADERVPERKYIQGSLPDEKKYRDASRFAIIVPHLRLLGDRVVLIKIKTKAANRAVRHAASIALRLCRCYEFEQGMQTDVLGIAKLAIPSFSFFKKHHENIYTTQPVLTLAS